MVCPRLRSRIRRLRIRSSSILHIRLRLLLMFHQCISNMSIRSNIISIMHRLRYRHLLRHRRHRTIHIRMCVRPSSMLRRHRIVYVTKWQTLLYCHPSIIVWQDIITYLTSPPPPGGGYRRSAYITLYQT